ncbi:iron-siderophore ABC transporter substrate-binding protein [Streptomyces sp. SID13726]|uniref:ABC transporter substrate-binding protein n=1 Tax=Streptomyces sp. SID13726 TaxID=2706058 RepID=UPI0013BE6FB9|nr:iron-siderophore ABC transporter substrate-binding protein [Streptomyces sp. SID13726]NEB03710.1 iron-siderophore ABC transporter substrate-binding protein [Streptomyces sp. SID13726]
MRRRLLIALAAAAAALALAGCGTTEPAADDTAPSARSITLTDASGAKVTLDGPAEKVVGTEWDVVEHLVSLGVQPVGVADIKGYTAWDTAAPLTGSPKDIGTRGEPSMDTIASLSPDLIVANDDLSDAVLKQLRKVAPVLEIRSARASDQIGQMETNLDLIAEATGTTDRAETLKKDFDAKLAEGRKALADAGLAGRGIAFGDGYVASNQVSIRPYTSGSLIGDVNDAIGLKNAWKAKGDEKYGLATTDVEGLTGLGDVEFAYIGNDADGSDPFTVDLAKNAVWKGLPFVKKGNVHRLPDGIWMFGGPKSMEAYVDALVAALTK